MVLRWRSSRRRAETSHMARRGAVAWRRASALIRWSVPPARSGAGAGTTPACATFLKYSDVGCLTLQDKIEQLLTHVNYYYYKLN